MDGTVTVATTPPFTALTIFPRSSDSSNSCSITATNIISYLSKPSNFSSKSASNSQSLATHLRFHLLQLVHDLTTVTNSYLPIHVLFVDHFLQQEQGLPQVICFICGRVPFPRDMALLVVGAITLRVKKVKRKLIGTKSVV